MEEDNLFGVPPHLLLLNLIVKYVGRFSSWIVEMVNTCWDSVAKLALQQAARGNKVVHKYQPGHGAQQHPVSERPLAAKLSAALRHRGAM